jgi:hypothetical protein
LARLGHPVDLVKVLRAAALVDAIRRLEFDGIPPQALMPPLHVVASTSRGHTLMRTAHVSRGL